MSTWYNKHTFDLDVSFEINTLTANNIYGEKKSANVFSVTAESNNKNILMGSTVDGSLVKYTITELASDDWYYEYVDDDTDENISLTATDTAQLRTFNVLEDVSATEEIVTWFTANTTKLS